MDPAFRVVTVAGVLARIDTESGRAEKVANVMPAARFPALAYRDGTLCGGGMNGQTRLMRWNTAGERIELLSDLCDPSTGERPARIHDLVVTEDHCIYAGENDNHERSSYLWSIRLD